MVDSGVDIDQIPPEEREHGDGPVTKAHLQWLREIKRLRENGKGDRADKMEQLLKEILEWRNKKSIDCGLAPASVLPEHTAKFIAYTRPASVEALHQMGMTVTGLDELSQIIGQFGPPPQQNQQ